VEILSALRERAPQTPEADADTLARLKTLAHVAGFLTGRTEDANAGPF